MIRAIVAIDTKRGLADDQGIPWQGRLPTDVQYYRDKIRTAPILMGYGVYAELSKPYAGVANNVASRSGEALRDGFVAVTDAHEFLQRATEDVWNVGGAGLFASTFDLIDELYITQLNQDFRCTKFFPQYTDKFELNSETAPQTENGITFTFQVWKRKKS